jgi:uncharacterized FlaG/YvyC family protein
MTGEGSLCPFGREPSFCVAGRETNMTEPLSAAGQAAGLADSNSNSYHVFGQANNNAELKHKDELSERVSVDRVVQALESYIDSNQTLEICVDKATGDMVVKVISYEDRKVIREIPSEEVLNRAAMIEQFEGLMFDTNI